MYTERARDPESRAVYNGDRSGFYSPKNSSDGSIARPEEKELHFVAHSMDKDKGNFPPHGVFIHINFADVRDLSGGPGMEAASGCRAGQCGHGKGAGMMGCKCAMGKTMSDCPGGCAFGKGAGMTGCKCGMGTMKSECPGACGCAGGCGMKACGCSK